MLLFLPAVLMVAGGAVHSPALAGSTPDQNRTCVDNPSGALSLNVDVVGVPGAPGPQGPQGEVGPGGTRGEKGQRGTKGQRGAVGGPGPKGDEGLRGPVGSKGQKGIRGAEGLQGPQGERGVEGVVGPRGHLGTPGPDGGRGPVGPSGPQGIRGPQGEPGDTVLSRKDFEKIRQQVYSSVLAEMNATLETVKDDNAQVDQKVKHLMDADAKLNATLETVKDDNAQADRKVKLLMDADVKIDNKLRSLHSEDVKLDSILHALSASLQGCCPGTTLCGIFGPWKKVKSFSTSNGDSCPPHLRTVSNQDNTKRACGRGSSRSGSCSSVSIPVNTEYSQVCGIVRGYRYYSTDAFYARTDSIDSYYVDGISITHGSPRRHLWTYASGIGESISVIPLRCPCARPDPLDSSDVPSFVGEDYYCESGFDDVFHAEILNDPLWDGVGCQLPGNQCCRRFGWFHRHIQPSSDDIELRICADEATSREDTLLESYEFWVI